MDETAAPSVPSATLTIVVGAKGRRSVDPLKVSIQPCDFRSPALLSEGDLRRLRTQQAEFARHFAAKVSAFLRLEFVLSLAGVTTLPYARFTQALPDPAHLTLFRLDPLDGLGIISLPPALGLVITNRMLGGRGAPPGEGGERALTEIEISLLEDFVRMIAEEWCRQWPEPPNAQPILVGYETNGKFLQTSPDDATMLVVSLDATLGERTHTLQIAMPFSALEANIKQAQPARPRAARNSAFASDPTLIIRRAAAAGISLPAVADWKVADITVRDVMNLRAGDVLELAAETLTRTRINLTGQPLFVGTAGVRDGRVAVMLTGRMNDDSAKKETGVPGPFASLMAQ